jgi:RNA methyltransferase, TrmH family
VATTPAARITSRHNPIVARYRAVAHGDVDGVLLLDGVHLVSDAVAAGLAIEHVAVDVNASGREEIAALMKSLGEAHAEIATVTAPVMAALSPVRSSSAIVAIAARPSTAARDFYPTSAGAVPLIVVACDIQDPGNLGAIVRVAEAGGASGVIAAGASADPFGWKALRGSMGSALRLPVHRSADPSTASADARHHRCRIIATVPRGGRSIFDADLRSAAAVFVGGEGPGLPQSVIDDADERVTIPMHAPVESLNAATTAALMVYEARRQRS